MLFLDDNIIRLNVYTFAAADALSKVIDEVCRPHIMPDIIPFDHISGFPWYCFIAPNGEFCIKKNVLEGRKTFNVDHSFIEHSVEVYLDFMRAITDFSDEVISHYLNPDFVKDQIKNLESILKYWRGTAVEDDIKFVGLPLNPFQTNELAEMINAADDIEKIRHQYLKERQYEKEHEYEQKYQNQLKKIAEKICENQNRPDDMELFDELFYKK